MRSAVTHTQRVMQLVRKNGWLRASDLANAGVPLHGLEEGLWAIPIAALGRPFGIVAAAGLAIAAGLHLPLRVGWRELVVIGCAATIGLVFTLFFATAVMPLGVLLLQLKLGALVTIAGSVLTFAVAWLLKVGRFAP